MKLTYFISKMAEMYAQLSATRAYLYALLKAADRDQKTLTNHDCAAVVSPYSY